MQFRQTNCYDFAFIIKKFGKYTFLTDEDVLLEKDLLQKAANIKRFEYPPLGKELKMQTSIAK